jgi:hypothetical protein
MPVTKILDIATTLPSVKRRRGRVGECSRMSLERAGLATVVFQDSFSDLRWLAHISAAVSRKSSLDFLDQFGIGKTSRVPAHYGVRQ